jgi:hypothetical protein
MSKKFYNNVQSCSDFTDSDDDGPRPRSVPIATKKKKPTPGKRTTTTKSKRTKSTTTAKKSTTTRKPQSRSPTTTPHGKVTTYKGYVFEGLHRSPASSSYKYEAVFVHKRDGKVRVIPFGKKKEKDHLVSIEKRYDIAGLMTQDALIRYILWNRKGVPEAVKDYRRALKDAETKTKK